MPPCFDLVPQNSENCDGIWLLAGEKVNVGYSSFHMWQESHSCGTLAVAAAGR